jgi:hypothetical protein
MKLQNQFTLMTLLITLFLVLLRKLSFTGDLVTYLIILLRINLKLIQYFRSIKENKVVHLFFKNEMQSSA